MNRIQNQFLEEIKIDRLLNGNEVAKLLNISRSFTYHLMKTGKIPTVRLGSAVRVRPLDLAVYIEENLHYQENEQ